MSRTWGMDGHFEGFLDTFGPVLVLKADIETYTALKPSGIVLPSSLIRPGTPLVTEVFGLPVFWSAAEDAEPALIYTPPKVYTDLGSKEG